MLTSAAREVLDEGVLCHVASITPSGPHLTPLVFALAGDRVWVTTSRGSTKARSWRRDDRVGGLVVHDGGAVSFGGRVRWHDALEPATWVRSALEGPLVTLASARFTRKNARFFAGYAVDANRVPLAWTPPGRVFGELRIERWARFERDGLAETWGDWRATTAAPAPSSSRRAGSGGAPIERLPADVAGILEGEGAGALAVSDATAPVVIPVGWRRSGSGVAVTVPSVADELVATTTGSRVALEVDRASTWRASEMLGAMLRGSVGRARPSGFELDVERVVWWRGWDSGTVAA